MLNDTKNNAIWVIGSASAQGTYSVAKELKLLQSRQIHFLPPALAVLVTVCQTAVIMRTRTPLPCTQLQPGLT
eukprot:15757912-Heterocapsa_arctica.AAC.1